MLPQPHSAPQHAEHARLTPSGSPSPVRIGVGIDTSRYGHYAAFLRDDLQPAAAELQFSESATGYAQLRQRLQHIVQRHGVVHFVIRLNAAGQYADNLLHFLHGLASSLAGASGSDPAADAARLAISLSSGEPQRNKNYRVALFGQHKSDPAATCGWPPSAPSASTPPSVPSMPASSPSTPTKRPSPSAMPCASSCTWSSPSGKARSRSIRSITPGRRRPTSSSQQSGIRNQTESRNIVTYPCHKRNKPVEPARSVVTAACSITSTPADPLRGLTPPGSPAPYVDFGHLKRQLPIGRVLDQLGLASRLRGSGPQKRCPCPIHRGDARGRTFSVHLQDGVFQCFDKTCAKKGDVIDLWACVRGLSLRDAALDLMQTFGLEPAPRKGTEKRKG